MEDNTYRWSPNNEDQPQKPQRPNLPDFKRIGKKVLVILLTVIVLMMAGTCFYTVDDKQQAVVTTFGKVTDVVDAGMHFKLPFGIQNVQKVDVDRLNQPCDHSVNIYHPEGEYLKGLLLYVE